MHGLARGERSREARQGTAAETIGGDEGPDVPVVVQFESGRGGMHTTPAMAAGVADHIWKLEEVVGLLDES